MHRWLYSGFSHSLRSIAVCVCVSCDKWSYLVPRPVILRMIIHRFKAQNVIYVTTRLFRRVMRTIRASEFDLSRKMGREHS